MQQHAKQMERARPGWITMHVEYGRLWTRVNHARAILGNPTIPNVDKVAGALAILDGAPVVLVSRGGGE